MNIKFEGKYKSITDFEWNGIPSFAIITGPNGSGKSQLLELIYNTLTNNRNAPERALIDSVHVKGDEVIFLKGEWHLSNTQPYDLSILKQQLNRHFKQFRGNELREGRIDPNQLRLYRAFQDVKEKSGKPLDQVTESEFISLFPDVIIEQEPQLGQKIGEIFYDYRLSEIELQANKVEPDKIIEQIGQKPWIVLKEIMRESKLPFKFSDPSNNGIKESFHFKLFSELSNEEISLNDLSSGEKVLISLVFYLYNSQEKKIFPKLLLLDEPDAHLHPTMAQQFLNVVKNILVEKYDVRVVMTTHSPSTVVLSSEDSLFEMFKEAPRIRRSQSKNHAISLLTSGLVFVGQGTKYVLVEDEDDVDFYSYLFTTLTNNGNISGDIPLVFIPASSTTKSGGKTVVTDWVNKLSTSGLDNVIKGLIDEDNGNVAPSGIYKIDRYSIENYLIDPIITYAALMDREKHFEVENVSLKVGEEYKLKILPSPDLQKIANEIFRTIEKNIKNSFPDWKETDKDRVDIEFLNGIKLSYPKWLIEKRGKTLLSNLYGNEYNSKTINFPTLFKALRKIELIPKDIADLFREIQKN